MSTPKKPPVTGDYADPSSGSQYGFIRASENPHFRNHPSIRIRDHYARFTNPASAYGLQAVETDDKVLALGHVTLVSSGTMTATLTNSGSVLRGEGYVGPPKAEAPAREHPEKLPRAEASSEASDHPVRIKRAPGSGMRWIADFLLSPRKAELLIETVIADFDYEFSVALRQGRSVKAFWIAVRYWSAFAWNIVSPLFAAIRSIWREPD